MKFKRILTAVTAAALCISLAGCGGAASSSSSEAATAESAPESTVAEATASPETAAEGLRVAGLKGPTTMGLVNLMNSAEGADYNFTMYGAADEIVPLLVKGELDAAAIPANLAATLYQKTNGQVEVACVNTLGVLYIVENGDTVQSVADLKGQTIVAAGKGSTPEYALRYLLSENGIDPDNDVTIDWKNEHSECVAALASNQATIALLPQPFVTVAQSKIDGLRMALDLTAEWDKLGSGSTLITGVIVARREVVEQNPAAVDAFLKEYAASVDWVNANNADAAALIGENGIVDAAVAEKALPYCNIVCLTGGDMQAKLSGYLQVLADANPASVGGSLPESDFYYVSK